MSKRGRVCILTGTTLLAIVTAYIGSIIGLGVLAGPALVAAFVLIVVGAHA